MLLMSVRLALALSLWEISTMSHLTNLSLGICSPRAIDSWLEPKAAIFITPFGDNWENHNLTCRHFRSVARLGAVFIRARRTRDGELTIKYLYRPPFSAIPIGISMRRKPR